VNTNASAPGSTNFDLEVPVRDLLVLPDQQPRLRDPAGPNRIDVEAVRVPGRSSIET
jgi:hypothetical protein